MYTLVEIVVSLGVLTTLVTVLSACVCGCKNSNQKSELVGTAGVVKIRFDEEVPSPTPTTPASVKRASTQNSQRSLPEIPHPVGRHDSGDTASEIYATVNLDEGNKVVAIPSTSRDHPYEHAYAKLQNQSDSHNITVEITPDQTSETELRIEEREATTSGPESVVISASVAISGQLPSSQELPYITPPSPRPHANGAQHFSGDSTDSAKGYTSISVREPLSNIRAQSSKNTSMQPHYATVSDDSDEMYAAIEEASVGEGSDTYAQIQPDPRRRVAPDLTAVSVPAHANDPHNVRRSAPPEIGASSSHATHSRQASSSSCSNSTGALGSPKPEKRSANSPLPPPPHPNSAHPTHSTHSTHPTHSTIHSAHTTHSTHTTHSNHGSHSSHSSHSNHPMHSSHPNHLSHSTHPTHPSHPATQRVAADQRHHQRISSTGDLLNQDKLRRSLNEKHQRNNSCVSSSDFYGCNYPVEKHRFSSGDIIRPLVAKELHFDIDQNDHAGDNLYNSIDGPNYSDYSSADANTTANSERITESPSRNVEEMYAKVMKRAKAKEEARKSKEFSNDSEPHTSKYRGDDPGYETIDRKKSTNHGYETIAHKERKISNQDPGYETVKEINKAPNSNFSNNNLLKLNHGTDSGPNSIISSDAGYEHISKTDNNASDSDPNYEVLRNQPPTPPYATIAPNYKVQPTYSTVNKRPSKYSNWPVNNNEEPSIEPNYESMPHDPLYTTGSESDPNYESVRPKDPNYESVNTQDPNYESLRCKDPKYESVRSKDPKYDSVRSKKDPNYESVKYYDLSKKDPPYERVNNDKAMSSDLERSDSSAGYEKINVSNNKDPKSSINNGADGTVSDYFQV